VEFLVFRQGSRDHALAEIGFDQDQRLAFRRLAVADAADEQGGMRPGRLRQILDDAGNVVVALDQQHVARLQSRAQGRWIARRIGLVALHRLLKIAGDHAPDAVEHKAHSPRPPDFCP
jgi:hypothetical protein